jgi:3-oxoacyl-[acyl-carrier-protein] synthase II
MRRGYAPPHFRISSTKRKSNQMTTIVVTGIGATSCLGGNARDTWEALLRRESGIRLLTEEWVETHELPVKFAGRVKVPASEVLERIEIKRLDPSAQLAVIAAREAWADAGAPTDPKERVLVDFATGIGGLNTLLDAWDVLKEKGPRRVLPMTIPMLMPNAAAAAISMDLQTRGGARTCVSACASGTESISNAVDHLRAGIADVVICGGTESVIHPLPIAAFAAMHALSTRNDDPARASRPYDKDRDGFVLGEGAAVLILETKEHAEARGAKIYAEIAGGSVSSDAHHITAPDPEGNGAARAVLDALTDAGVTPEDVNYINAHATSTPVGDIAEYTALHKVFGDRIKEIPVSATKSATGHLLGGTGALEAMFTVLSVHEKIAAPTLNLDNQDEAIPLDVVIEPRPLPDSIVAISNSFGFGGHNAVIVVKSI